MAYLLEFKNVFIELLFGTIDNYNSFIGTQETLSQQAIAYLIDMISFLIPMALVLAAFIVPIIIFIKAFKIVLNNTYRKTNGGIGEYEETKIFRKLKKRKN